MTAPSPRFGLGTTLEFLTSQVEIQITSIKPGEITRTEHDATHLGTPAVGSGEITNARKVPGKVITSGQWKFSGHYAGAIVNLIKAAPEVIRVRLPLLTGETTHETYLLNDSFLSGIMPGNIDPDEKTIQDVTLCVGGVLEYDPAA